MQSKVSNNLFYTCSLIEYIGRETKNKCCDIVNTLGKEFIEHIFNYADVFHCEQIAEVADRFIEEVDNEEIIEKLIEVYNSWITEFIDNYNMAVYYMTPQYLKLSYEEGEL